MVSRLGAAAATIAVACGCVTLGASAGAAATATAGHLAGFTANANAKPTQSAGATLVVPKLDCGAVPSGGFQAVVAGVRLHTLGGSSAAGVSLVCASPTPLYGAAIQINGSPVSSSITVAPGDVVSVSVNEGTSGTSVTIVDGSQSQTVPGPGGTVTSLDVGVIATNCGGTPTCSPAPKMRATRFTAVGINGEDLHAARAKRFDIVDASSVTEVSSSKASKTSSYTAFRAAWLSSCSVGPGTC